MHDSYKKIHLVCGGVSCVVELVVVVVVVVVEIVVVSNEAFAVVPSRRMRYAVVHVGVGLGTEKTEKAVGPFPPSIEKQSSTPLSIFLSSR